MKKLLILLVSVMLMYSCDRPEQTISDRPEQTISNPPELPIPYKYVTERVVPDSNKVKMAEWISKTISSTNSQLSAGDYEEPEDVIKQCEETAFNLFSVEEPRLRYLSKNGFWRTLEKDRMTEKEIRILDSLKYNQR